MGNKLTELIDTIDKEGITAYEISKNTGLSEYGVQKILDGTTSSPREATIIKIHNFVNSKVHGISSEEHDHSLNTLELTVLQNWDRLKKRPGFAAKIDVEIKEAIILRLEEIIKNNSK